MKGVGYLSQEDAISYGCTGPTARGSGVSCDIRKLYPYEVYDEVQFNEITETGGDCFARFDDLHLRVSAWLATATIHGIDQQLAVR